MRNIPVVVAF